MNATGQAFTMIAVGLAAVVAVMVALFTQAKKFLDSDQDYVDKIEDVETKNLSAARIQLQWISRDLTDPQSVYAIHTYDSEQFVYSKTREIVHCFERIRKCRFGMNCARPAFEVTKWASLVSIVTVILTAAGQFSAWPEFWIHVIFVVGLVASGFALVGFAVAEICLQLIRRQFNKSKYIDATLLP